MTRIRFDTSFKSRFSSAELPSHGSLQPLFATAMALCLAGCASPMRQQDKASFQASLDAGDYHAAEGIATQAGQIGPDGQSANVVWSLNAGAAMFDAGDMHQSVAVLDATERLAQRNDLDRMHAAVDYHYTTYDGVMTNVYKAMAFLAQGDKDGARVEFNRAEDRQKRAEEHFQAEIAAAEARHNSGADPQYGSVLAQAQQSREYQDAVNNLGSLAVYAPFENPFATYIAGVFFINEGDYDKGMYRLKRASLVLGPDSPARADIEWAARMHRRRAKPAPQVWVVFENGQSATYHELRLVLPMVTGQPMTLALPMLAANAPAYPALTAEAGGASAQTAPAGSFDAVMASEFRRRQPLILAEAVAEVVAKNAGSMIAQKSNNAFLQLASAIVANVSTADTRSWTALPKEFQVARLNAPEDGKVDIKGPGGETLAQADVPAGQPSIVWVKMQAPGAHPAVQVLKL